MVNHSLPPTQQPDSRQVALYGEPWSARLTRLLQAYRISQAKLGAVIGLSAPMISQLMSGARVKISNPAVFGRIVRLEEMLDSPVVRQASTEQILSLLTEITSSTPMLSTISSPMTEPQSSDNLGTETLATQLSSLATAHQLRQLSQAAVGLGAQQLAVHLERAAGQLDRAAGHLDHAAGPTNLRADVP